MAIEMCVDAFGGTVQQSGHAAYVYKVAIDPANTRDDALNLQVSIEVFPSEMGQPEPPVALVDHVHREAKDLLDRLFHQKQRWEGMEAAARIAFARGAKGVAEAIRAVISSEEMAEAT